MAMPARRAAAGEPQPLPVGVSFFIRRESGMTFASLALRISLLVARIRWFSMAPQISTSCPVAVMEKVEAGWASMVMKRSIARAAASKAGPRFAEVAGRARRSEVERRLFFLGIRVRAIGFLCLLQSFDHSVQRGIQDDGRMPERIQSGAFALVRSALEKIAAMESHGKVGVLEQVSRENQHNRLFRLHKSLTQQFL